MGEEAKSAGAEHGREGASRRAIDGERMRDDAAGLCLAERLAHVLDAVATFVAIEVGGLAVGDEEEEAFVSGDVREQPRRVPERRANARVALRDERAEASASMSTSSLSSCRLRGRRAARRRKSRASRRSMTGR